MDGVLLHQLFLLCLLTFVSSFSYLNLLGFLVFLLLYFLPYSHSCTPSSFPPEYYPFFNRNFSLFIMYVCDPVSFIIADGSA